MRFRRASRDDVPGVTTSVGTTSPEPAAEPGRTPKKGRPTRNRREAIEARQRPLVPADRKEARRQSRARSNEARAQAQQAMMTGDEAHMPAQHRGSDRRLVRDMIDARHNLAEYFFPVALVLMLVALVTPLLVRDLYAVMSTLMLVVLWGGILACVIDAFVIRRRLRAALTERFGSVSPGLVSYGNMRAIQIRRWRIPKPQVKHGDTPRR